MRRGVFGLRPQEVRKALMGSQIFDSMGSDKKGKYVSIERRMWELRGTRQTSLHPPTQGKAITPKDPHKIDMRHCSPYSWLARDVMKF